MNSYNWFTVHHAENIAFRCLYCRYHAIASSQVYDGVWSDSDYDGIPAHEKKVAWSSSLYLKIPGIPWHHCDHLFFEFFCSWSPCSPDEDTSSTPLQYVSNDNGASILSECQADCDNNSDCDGDLECWQRDEYDTDPIPGCTGDLLAIDVASGNGGNDFCYDPDATIAPSGLYQMCIFPIIS